MPQHSAGKICACSQITVSMSSFSFKRQVVKRFYNTSPRNPLNSVKCSLFPKSTFRNRKVLVALRKPSVQFTLQLVRCLSDHLEGKLP